MPIYNDEKIPEGGIPNEIKVGRLTYKKGWSNSDDDAEEKAISHAFALVRGGYKNLIYEYVDGRYTTWVIYSRRVV